MCARAFVRSFVRVYVSVCECAREEEEEERRIPETRVWPGDAVGFLPGVLATSYSARRNKLIVLREGAQREGGRKLCFHRIGVGSYLP